jgi:hypothetical protein
MTSKDQSAPGFKEKAKHVQEKAKREMKAYIAITIYLGFFFCALSTYHTLILRKYNIEYLDYTFALVNALVIAKVILIGEMFGLGKELESKPLYVSILYKTFVFGLLVFAFHIVEEFIKRVIHHEPGGTVLHNLKPEETLAKTIVIVCAFIPLFAFREVGRVLGEDRLHALFFKRGAAENPALSPTQP